MKQYLSEIHQRFQYRATWEPNKALAIGDIGILEKGIFSLRSTLEKEGMPVVNRSNDGESDMKYASESAVDIDVKLAGKVSLPQSKLAEAEAGVVVKFNKEQAVVFHLKGCRSAQIENLGEIEKEVLQRYYENRWSKDWVIITELITAESGTILISSSKDSIIELKASGDIPAVAGLDLADTEMHFAVVNKRGIATEIIGKKEMTPLYRVAGIRRPFFGDLSIGTKELFGEVVEEIPFEEGEVE